MVSQDHSLDEAGVKLSWWRKIPNTAWILGIGVLLFLIGLIPSALLFISWIFGWIGKGTATFFNFWDLRIWGWGKWAMFLTFVAVSLLILHRRRR